MFGQTLFPSTSDLKGIVGGSKGSSIKKDILKEKLNSNTSSYW